MHYEVFIKFQVFLTEEHLKRYSHELSKLWILEGVF